MNTVRSTFLGWGALVAAAGVSWVYAKKGIDERRREQHTTGQRPAEVKDWRQRVEESEAQRRLNASGTDTHTTAPSPHEAYKAAQPGKE